MGPSARERGRLSPRDLQIAALVARGRTNAQIARDLALSPGTVANHVERILRKLGLPSRSALAAWAVERRLRRAHDRYLTTLERLLDIRATSLAEAMDQAAQALVEMLAVDKVDLFVYRPDQDSLVAVGAAQTPLGRRQRALGLARLPLEQHGRIDEVFRTGQPYLTGHAERDPAVRAAFTRGLGVRSVVAVPLVVAGQRLGVLLVQATRPEAFGPGDLRFLRTVAHWVGSIVQRSGYCPCLMPGSPRPTA